MQAKPLMLLAALITLPSATAFAQATTDQPATSQDATPTSGPSPASPSPQGPAGSSQSSAVTAAVVPATIGDLTPKAIVYDKTGAEVGTIESVTSSGAVVSTGTARAEIPVASFAKNSSGLVIGMTKLQLEAAVAKASASK